MTHERQYFKNSAVPHCPTVKVVNRKSQEIFHLSKESPIILMLLAGEN